MSKDEACKFIDDAVKRGEEEQEELRKLIRDEIKEIKDLFVSNQSEIDQIKKNSRTWKLNCPSGAGLFLGPIP